MKPLLRDLTPPLFWRALQRLRNAISRQSTSAPDWEYLPEGWNWRPPNPKGWDDPSIVETQLAKWPHFLAAIQPPFPLGVAHEATLSAPPDYAAHHTYMAYAYVLALAARRKDALSMLDWGGGIGHYAALSRVLLPGLALDYYCKDMPTLCAGGRQVLPEAHFTADEAECFQRAYDLVLVSGSLHYTPDWRALVIKLAAATRGYLYVTRLPVVEHAESFVVVQRPYRYGYQTEYIGWFLNRPAFIEQATRAGLELVREFLIPEKPKVAHAPEQGEYRGYLFRPAGRSPAE